MRIASVILGLLCIVIGSQIASHGPSDIQIGIGSTAIMGGVILFFIGALFASQEKISRSIADFVASQERKTSSSSVEAVAMTDEERKSYEFRVSQIRPGQYSD